MPGAGTLLAAGCLIFFLLGLTPLRAEERSAGGAQDARRPLMNGFDRGSEPALRERAADWRIGAVVYQVFVDRFAPGVDPQSKKALYPAPRKLRAWSELPRAGGYLPDVNVWSHEIDFWGGDLDGLRSKLDYIQGLGIDVVYLNPIFLSFTNHKYDAWDYHKVDPAFGTREDLAELVGEAHSRGMRVVLDGVFNHMGVNSPMFQDALKNPASPWREFFVFKGGEPGYVGWLDVANLPELNLESPRVRDYIYGARDSVIQSYLRQEGVDGWRLDVAFDLGFTILDELTRAAHGAKSGSVVIGEIWNYPEEWFPSVDGVMNMHGRAVLLHMLAGKISGPTASAMWETMIAEAGIDNILRSWLILDNHDTQRLATLFPDERKRRMARMLQFTLPGSVCLYYGSELGMTGGEDPEMRAPMRWDLVRDDNATLFFHKALLALRKKEPALRYGDFRRLQADGLFAFLRRAASVRDTVVVVANPTADRVSRPVQLRESKFQDYTDLRDLFSGRTFKVFAGIVEVELEPFDWVVLKVDTNDWPKGYNRYDRVY